MNIELKKKLQSLELSDFVEAIEAQENNISYVDKTFDERLNDVNNLFFVVLLFSYIGFYFAESGITAIWLVIGLLLLVL